MDNFENNKKAPEAASANENKGGKKHYHNKKHHYHHHRSNRQGQNGQTFEAAEAPKTVAEAPVEASTPSETEPKAHNRSNNHNRRNRNRGKGNQHRKNDRLPEEELIEKVQATPEAPAKSEEPKAQNKNQPKSRLNDRPKNQDSAPLMSELPEEGEYSFIPSRNSESDFLSLGKTDDSYLDSMPLDPTLDKVFADVVPTTSEPIEGPEIVGIRFEHGSKVYYFDPNGGTYKLGEHAIVETAQGLEYGEIVIANRCVSENQIVSPLRPVVRSATKEDTAHHEDNRRRQNEAFKICLGKIADHGLDMKLVDTQYTFDNTKLIFFFTSAGRVDFRALVKDLASIFRTRIELRQIGIRDEARMVGGFGVCGRKLCCAGFLPNFVQVSIKMAKEQGLSINASKISGNCGRLMCCLRYEQEAYEREIALMPPPESVVDTPDGRGVVTDIFPISGNLKVKLNDKPDVAPKNYHMSNIRVIKKANRLAENENVSFDDASDEE